MTRKHKTSKKVLNSTKKSIILVIIATILTSTGQICMKYATSHLGSITEIITNIPLILGLFLYAIASGLLIVSLRGADLSLVYPFIALSFVWVTSASILLFNEHVTLFNWLGIGSIILGVSLLGGGAK